MKADRHWWVGLSVVFCVFGTRLLLDGTRTAGANADDYVIVGATLTALGLATLLIAFEQYKEVRAMAEHMRGGAHLPRKSRAPRTPSRS
ncbi:MAG: hypothetical protein WBE13_05535 [Candidatus Acidiferrum sp.]